MLLFFYNEEFMKRSLAVLALLTLSSASLCAAENYNREKVLALFAQYNPAVLEKAQQDGDYNALVQEVADAYNLPETDENRYTLLALIRNFDNSLDLNNLTAVYEKTLYLHATNGLEVDSITERFSQDLVPVFSRIWAVSLQTHTQHLQEAKARVKEIKKDKSLTAAQRKEALDEQEKTISFLKQEIKNLKKDAASRIVTITDDYAAQVKQDLLQQLSSRSSVTAHNTAVQETENLSLISKNKKPVAK